MGRQQERPIKYYGGSSLGLEVGLMTAGELKGRLIQMITSGRIFRKNRKNIDTNSY